MFKGMSQILNYNSSLYYIKFISALKNKNSYILWGFLILSLLILYTIYVSYSPLWIDDYSYIFFRNNNPLKEVYHNIPILNLYTDNFADVSRFVPHLIIGIFQYIGKPFFNVISGFIFIYFGYCIARLVTNESSKWIPLTIINCGINFFIIDGFFDTSVWMSGVPNYLIPAILVSIFIKLLKKNETITKNITLNYFLLFFYGLITGWTNEGFIVGLTGACIIYYGFINKKEFNKNRKSLIFGLISGCLFLCLSSYNISKVLVSYQGKVFSYHDFIRELLYIGFVSYQSLTVVKITGLFLISILILNFIIKKKNLLQHTNIWFKENLFIILCLFISLIFLFLTLFNSSRSRFPIEFYSLILMMSLVAKWNNRLFTFIGLSSISAMIITLIIIFPSLKNTNMAFEDMAKQFRANQDIIITKHINMSKLESRFLKAPQYLIYPHTISKIFFISSHYNNLFYPYIIDEDKYKTLSSDNSLWKFHYNTDWKGCYIRIPNDRKVIKVEIVLSPSDLETLRIPFEKYGLKTDKYRYVSKFNRKSEEVTIGDERWLLVPDNKLLRKKCNKIIIKSISKEPDALYIPNYNNKIPTELKILDQK